MTNETSKTRRKVSTLAVAAALLGALGVSSAYALGPVAHDIDPAKVQAMITKRLDRVLDRVDATDDQKTRIKGTLLRAAPQMQALRSEKEKLRVAMGKALAADRVDPNEVERLRREALKLAERGSALLSGTVLEVSQVLDAEQRRELLTYLERRWGRH